MSGMERQPAARLDKASIMAIAKAVAAELRSIEPPRDQRHTASNPETYQGRNELMKLPEPFLVGWESFGKSLQRKNGFKTFIVVDDYTSIDLWNRLCPRLDGLPPREENWDVHIIVEPIAADNIYINCGCVRPRYDQQPVIYCIEQGQDVGRYILRATVDEALAFMESELSHLQIRA
jgi:hypothetical protein